MKKLIKSAQEMSEAFETRERDNGDKFRVLKNGSPEWMTEIVHTVHGDALPDDTIYRFIEMTVDAIADCDPDATEDDIQERLYEIEPDVYTSDLTEWLHARNDHVYYLTEALEEFNPRDGFQALSMAQANQIKEVAFDTLSALENL